MFSSRLTEGKQKLIRFIVDERKRTISTSNEGKKYIPSIDEKKQIARVGATRLTLD